MEFGKRESEMSQLPLRARQETSRTKEWGGIIGNQAVLFGCSRRTDSERAPVQRLEENGIFRREEEGPKKKISYPRPDSEELMAGANVEEAMPMRWKESRTPGTMLNHMTYHHVIPFNKLAMFWDALVEGGDIKGFQAVMRPVIAMHFGQMESARASHRAKPEAEDEFFHPDREASVGRGDMERFLEHITEISFRKDMTGTPDEQEQKKKDWQRLELLSRMYTWMPFNLVHGQGDRRLDPHEEFDQTAAEITGQPRIYRELMFLMDQYQKASSISQKQSLIPRIGEILNQQAERPVTEYGSSMETLDNDIKEQIISILSLAEQWIGTFQKGAKGIKRFQAMKNNLERLLKSKKTDMGDLQRALTALLFESAEIDSNQENHMQSLQGVIDQYGNELTGFQVEYGSGVGNNCFFEALFRLGFHTADMQNVGQMRDWMDALRDGVEGYNSNAMITIADAQEFANHFDIIVHMYTTDGTNLIPAGVIGTNNANGNYYILHQGLHYMPMHPPQE